MRNCTVTLVGTACLTAGIFVGFLVGQRFPGTSITKEQNLSTTANEDVEYLLYARGHQNLWKHINRYNWAKIEGHLLQDSDYQALRSSLEELFNDDDPKWQNYRTVGGSSRPTNITFGKAGSELVFHIRTTPEGGFEVVRLDEETVITASVLPQHMAVANDELLRLIHACQSDHRESTETKQAEQDPPSD
jgi:hypothetical protein